MALNRSIEATGGRKVYQRQKYGRSMEACKAGPAKRDLSLAIICTGLEVPLQTTFSAKLLFSPQSAFHIQRLFLIKKQSCRRRKHILQD
jgi:hypothetical protein